MEAGTSSWPPECNKDVLPRRFASWRETINGKGEFSKGAFDLTFKELAWGAFVFKFMAGSTDISYYQPLASDKDFLMRLRTNPVLEDFEELRNFLVHYGVHYAPKDLPRQYVSVWSSLQPHIQRLSTERLETCEFNNAQIQNEILAAFNCLFFRTWGGDTVVSKVLHFFNISLFVMVDSDITMHFSKYGSRGYLEFLQDMQREAVEVLNDFQQLGLSGRLEEFLSHELNYSSIRPLTKLIDDYNWVTITRGWPKIPPDWLLDLFVWK